MDGASGMVAQTGYGVGRLEPGRRDFGNVSDQALVAQGTAALARLHEESIAAANLANMAEDLACRLVGYSAPKGESGSAGGPSPTGMVSTLHSIADVMVAQNRRAADAIQALSLAFG